MNKKKRTGFFDIFNTSSFTDLKNEYGFKEAVGLTAFGLVFSPYVLWEVRYREKNPPPWECEDPVILRESFFTTNGWANGTVLGTNAERTRSMIICQFGNLWCHEALDELLNLLNDPRVEDYLSKEKINHELGEADRLREYVNDGWTKEGPPKLD